MCVMLLSFLIIFFYSVLGMLVLELFSSFLVVGFMFVCEFFFGVMLGFFIRMFFVIVEGVGLMVGTSMVLGFGNVVDSLIGE